MKIIRGKQTVVTHVGSTDTHLEYRVTGAAHLTLAVVVEAKGNVSINVIVHLMGKNAIATIVGIVRSRHGADIRFHTMQHHGAVNTTSNLLVKSVLTGTSKFSYDGSIYVDPVAQKTDAYQRNENLLLDSASRASSEPALEILANDVRCTHGATIGTVNDDELWYLATRGIDPQTARSMIADGFLRSAFELIPDTIVRSDIETKCLIPYA